MFFLLRNVPTNKSQSIKEPPLCEEGKYLNTDVMHVCADLEKTGYYSESIVMHVCVFFMYVQ